MPTCCSARTFPTISRACSACSNRPSETSGTILDKLPFYELPLLCARQLYWSFCLDRVIYNHRRDADALGIDLHDAVQKGVRSQERLVANMGTARGIWKDRF